VRWELVSPGLLTFAWDCAWTGGYELEFRRAGQSYRAIDVAAGASYEMPVSPPYHQTSCVWRVRAYALSDEGQRVYGSYSPEMNFELKTDGGAGSRTAGRGDLPPPTPKGLDLDGPGREGGGRWELVSPGRVTFSWNHSWTGRGGYELEFRGAGHAYEAHDVASGATYEMNLSAPDQQSACVWRVRAYRLTDRGEKVYGGYSEEMSFELKMT
jgi:hypothetical protein